MFRNVVLLWCLVQYIIHFWRSNFKQKLICKCHIAENFVFIVLNSVYTCLFAYIHTYVLISRNTLISSPFFCLIFTSQLMILL